MSLINVNQRLGLRCKVYPEEDVVLLIFPVRGAEEDIVEDLRFETLGVGILQPPYHLRKHILHLIIPPTYR